MTVLDYLKTEGSKVSAPCNGNGTCGGCLVDITLSSGEVKRVLACQTEYLPGMEISVPDREIDVIGAQKIAGTYDAGNFVAIDIGTTTIAMALVDGKSGDIISEYGCPNSQRAYGADVISRISASNSGYGNELRKLVIDDLKKGLCSLGTNYEKIVISANTTMIHLLLGYSCEKLGVYPFEPVNLFPDTVLIEDLSDKQISFIPGISAFVGSDIVSGLLTLPTDGVSLLADLGTNGEMVLWDENSLYVTSTAAGPAFEESRLSYGADSIKMLAGYLKEGIIDSTGLIENEEKCNIKGEDIAKLQLAKAAIRTGIELLLDKTKTLPGEVSHLYIAGGFGAHLTVEDAVTIGLIPSEMNKISKIIGNSSLDGAVAFGLNGKSKLSEAQNIIEKAIKVDLANDPKFNDLFAENMMF